MNGWAAFALHLAIATAIASGVMVQAGRTARRRPETRKALPMMFPWLDEQRTYANAVSIARYALTQPTVWAVWVFASAPAVAAILVSLVGDGESDLGSLIGRLSPVADGADGRAAAVTYAVIVAVFVVVSACYLRVANAAEPLPPVMRGRSRPQVWARLTGGMFVDEGGSLEELGWRAFSLPALVVATGSLWWSTIVLAVSWWAWHLPREVPALRRRPDWKRFVTLQAQFVWLCLGLSVLMTVAWRHTGSVWPAVMIHGGTNVWSKAIGAPMWARAERDVRTDIVTVLAVVAVLAEVIV
ncbi:MAG: CPBP family intramembrane metalloprotease [Actinobacteria bacterium]|nr:CPBP family intramembrane metalloprotease [Actinomycetota bacterium]